MPSLLNDEKGDPERVDSVINDTASNRLQTIGIVVLLTAVGIGLSVISQSPIVRTVSALVGGSDASAPTWLTVNIIVGYGLDLLVIGGFLALSKRGLAYLDISRFELRHFGYVIGGVLANFAGEVILSVAVSLLDLPASQSSTQEFIIAGGTATMLTFLVLTILITGPVEELFYRNIVQKRLSENVPHGIAITIAGLLFALSHVPAVYDPNLVTMIEPLTSSWIGGIIYGAIYLRTQNIIPAMLTHGVYNATIVGLVLSGVL